MRCDGDSIGACANHRNWILSHSHITPIATKRVAPPTFATRYDLETFASSWHFARRIAVICRWREGTIRVYSDISVMHMGSDAHIHRGNKLVQLDSQQCR
jgi:hypothetical protein